MKQLVLIKCTPDVVSFLQGGTEGSIAIGSVGKFINRFAPKDQVKIRTAWSQTITAKKTEMNERQPAVKKPAPQKHTTPKKLLTRLERQQRIVKVSMPDETCYFESTEQLHEGFYSNGGFADYKVTISTPRRFNRWTGSPADNITIFFNLKPAEKTTLQKQSFDKQFYQVSANQLYNYLQKTYFKD